MQRTVRKDRKRKRGRRRRRKKKGKGGTNRESGEKAGKHHQQQQQKETRLSSCFTSTPLEQKNARTHGCGNGGSLAKEEKHRRKQLFFFQIDKTIEGSLRPPKERHDSKQE